MKNAVLVTGTNGGIGSKIKEIFQIAGYSVIGVDRYPDAQDCDEYLKIDFIKLCLDSVVRDRFSESLVRILREYKLCGLVNNAAIQILADMNELSVESFIESNNVNLVAPFILSKMCLSELDRNKGSIVNVGSIHGRLTKKKFIAYATSKGALEALTRAMAVDIGDRVRVNSVSPAAIETEMLSAGFKDNSAAYLALKNHHPTKCIGRPEEVAKMIFSLINDDLPFLNGAIIDMSGGISSRLHDPV